MHVQDELEAAVARKRHSTFAAIFACELELLTRLEADAYLRAKRLSYADGPTASKEYP